MRNVRRSHVGWLLAAAMGVCLAGQARPQTSSLDLEGIAGAMGKKCVMSGPMCKVSFRRDDLKVTVGKLRIDPALALTNWAAFIKSGEAAVTYGYAVELAKGLETALDAQKK